MKDYKILEAGFGPQRLSQMVNKAIEEGWIPLGAPFVIPFSISDLSEKKDSYFETQVCQAMMRKPVGSRVVE